MSQSQQLLLIPGYRIERILGKGAMATAYLAIQESLEREVALKIMDPKLVADQTFHERFLSEGKIIARLNHPNIVDVYDIGITDQDIYYMTLEYAPRGNLTERMQNGLTATESLNILRQIANALSYAHSQGVIHRDVKPRNILFCSHNTALLSDFGIAKVLDSLNEMTAVGWIIGTPAYMSPEQSYGQRASPQSDLYSLGIVFYEMLSGQRPQKTDDSKGHINTYTSLLPPELSAYQHIVDRLLKKDPQDRYQTADELLQDIDLLESSGNFLIDADKTRVKTSYKTRHESTESPHHSLKQKDSGGTFRNRTSRQYDAGRSVSHAPEIAPRSSNASRKISDLKSTTVERTKSGSLWVRGLSILFVSILLIGVIFWFRNIYQPDKADNLQQVLIDGPTYFLREKERYLRELSASYQKLLELDPDNIIAHDGLIKVADIYAELAQISWQNLDYTLSINLIYDGLRLVPDHKGLLNVRKIIEHDTGPSKDLEADRRTAWQWLREADEHLAETRFIIPADDNAIALYRKVIQIDPHNEIARRRLDDMASVFQRLAQEYLDRGEIESAISYIEQGLFISPMNSGLMYLQSRLKNQSHQ